MGPNYLQHCQLNTVCQAGSELPGDNEGPVTYSIVNFTKTAASELPGSWRQPWPSYLQHCQIKGDGSIESKKQALKPCNLPQIRKLQMFYNRELKVMGSRHFKAVCCHIALIEYAFTE